MECRKVMVKEVECRNCEERGIKLCSISVEGVNCLNGNMNKVKGIAR